MKFIIESKELTAGLISVIKALPIRTSMPILEGVYLEASEQGLVLKCSDLMLQKECLLPATVAEEGKAIVPGKLFFEIVRKLPDDMADITLSENTLEIVCGRAKSSIQCIEFEEFPEMRFSGEAYPVKMKAADCRSMINQTVFATAQDDSKPILTGALFEIGDSITVVATDAYQFAMRSIPLETPLPQRSMVVPNKTVAEIARMTEEAEDEIELTFTPTHVKMDVNHACLTARLLDGDYINYKQILPKEYKTRVLADRKELMESIDRAQLMAREGNNNIVMRFHENELHITANSFVGKIDEKMDVQIVGDDIDIAFNPKFCMNILKCIEDEKIYMDFTTSISPCVVKPSQGEGYYYLIVPVRIYSQF